MNFSKCILPRMVFVFFVFFFYFCLETLILLFLYFLEQTEQSMVYRLEPIHKEVVIILQQVKS